MANSEQKLWATDVIGDDYKNWNREKVLLGLGTGRGKTTFALSIYCPYLIKQGKSILYLCNRKELFKQIERELVRLKLVDYVTLTTYQKVENLIRKKDTIPNYDVYICDEAHYFLADSEFNLYTDLSYNHILRQKEATILYMTATYHNIFTRLKLDDNIPEDRIYLLPTDYSYVNKVCWYKGKQLYGIVDTILRTTTEDKILYFCNGITRMEKFYKHYSPKKSTEKDSKYSIETNLKYMDFICSDYAASPFVKKHSNPDAIIKDVYGGYSFNNRILISTKCLDNGVDFKDRNIKHIICDIYDLESAMQCLGRKRILDDNDTCTFYIRNYQHYECKTFYDQVVNELAPVQLFDQYYNNWVLQYGNDRSFKNSTIFYDFEVTNEWHINQLRYDKLKNDEIIIKNMMDKKKILTASYRVLVSNYLGNSVNDRNEIVDTVIQERIKTALDIFLETNVDKQLSKEEQSELIDIYDIHDAYGRKKKSIKVINSHLEEDKLPFQIESTVSKNMSNKSERGWTIRKRKSDLKKIA
jgi:hypothetical protein